MSEPDSLILRMLTALRDEQAATREDIRNMAADITVLTGMVLRIERELVRMRETLAQFDRRIRKLEER